MATCNECCEGEGKYYVGDIGTQIEVDVCTDISTATRVELRVVKPDGTTATWVGTVLETTKIRYIVQAGDFSVDGRYRIQPYVEMPSWRGKGNTATFVVSDMFA